MTVRRSLWITFAYSNASTIALFSVSLILARILTPQQIGVFSLSVAVINVAAVFRDLGVNPYLIRKGEVTAEDIGSVLGLTLTTSWTLAAMLWFGRHAIASYFGEPQIAEVLPILLISFLIIPVAGTLTSLFIRDLSAGKSALVSIVGTVTYATVVLTLALTGFGAKAPAWANTANIFAGLVCSLVLMPKGLRLKPRWSGWGPPLKFSGGVMLGNLSNVAFNSLPDAAIGRTLGAHEVGLYSRASGTVGLFHQVVGPTLTYNALPILAKARQGNEAENIKLLVHASQLIAVLAWPIYVWVALFPAEIIHFLYGKSWVAAAVFVPWLCLGMIVRTPFTIISSALQAADLPYVAAIASAGSLISRFAFLILIGGSDLRALVIGLTVADMISQIPWAYAGQRYLGLRILDLLKGLRSSLLVALACLAAAGAVKYVLMDLDVWPIASVLASGFAICVAWLSSIFLVRHPLAGELSRGWARFKQR